MDEKAIEIVKDYIGEHLDKSDIKPDFEVYTVWKCKAFAEHRMGCSKISRGGLRFEITGRQIYTRA